MAALDARCYIADVPTTSRLPRAIVGVFLAAPLVLQPIVNAEFFGESPLRILVEVGANYLPALAILGMLALVFRLVRPRLVAPAKARLAVDAILAAAAAVLASLAVHPLHRLVTGELDFPLSVYLQRNVGFTCAVVLTVLLLERHRERAQVAERDLVAERRGALRMQLDALRSRAQPHFLFNVLNTIASLIRDDAELAEQTVHRLADLLRYALEAARVDTVPLARELEVVAEYLEVQRARFGARLRWELAVAPDADALAVPPFVLQPLVENAVLHAVAQRAEGGLVRISARAQGGRLVLEVDDDRPGPGGSRHRGTRTGLADLEQRLALVYGDDATTTTRSNDAGGFTVVLDLPARAVTREVA